MPGYSLLPEFFAARVHGGSFHLSFNLAAQPVLALVAGVLILVRPKQLNAIVAGYLILVGLIGVFNISW